jgi:hypothetical protein
MRYDIVETVTGVSEIAAPSKASLAAAYSAAGFLPRGSIPAHN